MVSTPLIVVAVVSLIVAAWWVSRLGERGPGRSPHDSSQPPLSPSPESVRVLLARGEKIQAIKMLRTISGLGLKEAHDAIEAMQRGGLGALPVLTPSLPVAPEEMNPEIERLVATGQVIEAIKLYRELTGAGLKESKDAVDLIRVRSQK